MLLHNKDVWVRGLGGFGYIQPYNIFRCTRFGFLKFVFPPTGSWGHEGEDDVGMGEVRWVRASERARARVYV